MGDEVTRGEQQLDLPFDQYQRYRLVTDILDRLRTDAGTLRLLDVGGREGTILSFLRGDEVIVVERMAVEGGPGFVREDATALPFEDASFDYAVSVDTLEHIAPDARERHLSELRRVARRGVLLAAPFAGGGVREAEALANGFFRALYGQEHQPLYEHDKHGLPELADVRRFYEALGDRVTALPNGYLPNWLTMMCLSFYRVQPRGELTRTAEGVNRFYNRYLYGYDNSEPCYGYVVAALRDPAPADLEGLAAPTYGTDRADAALALLGALMPTLPLGGELRRLNSSLAQKDNQLALTQVRMRDLSRRLAEQVAQVNASARLRQENQRLRRELEAMTSSRAWRVVALLRKLRSLTAVARGR